MKICRILPTSLQPQLVRLGRRLLRLLGLLQDGLHDVLTELLPQLRQAADGSYQLVRLHAAPGTRGRLVALGESGVQVGRVHVLQAHVLGDAAQVEVAAHAEAAVRALLPVVSLLVAGKEGVEVGGPVIEAVSHHHLLGLAHGHVLVAGGPRPHLALAEQILSLGLQHLQLGLLQLQHLLVGVLVDPGVLPLGLLGHMIYEVLLPGLGVLHLPPVRQRPLGLRSWLRPWLRCRLRTGLRSSRTHLAGLDLGLLGDRGDSVAGRTCPGVQSADLVGVKLLKY